MAIIEAEPNDELSQIVQSLPFWGLMKVDVVPLESFEHKVQLARQTLERLKTAMK